MSPLLFRGSSQTLTRHESLNPGWSLSPNAGAEEALYRGHQRRCDQHQPAGRAYDQHTRSRSDPGAPRSDAAIFQPEKAVFAMGDFFTGRSKISGKKRLKKHNSKETCLNYRNVLIRLIYELLMSCKLILLFLLNSCLIIEKPRSQWIKQETTGDLFTKYPDIHQISRPKNLGTFHSNAMVANDATVKITG